MQLLSMIPCSYLIELASCRWARSDVRPLLSRWSKCGGGVGHCGCNDVLEQGIIILVCIYHSRAPWEQVNSINFKFLFNMTFVSPMLVMEVVWTLLYRTCIELWHCKTALYGSVVTYLIVNGMCICWILAVCWSTYRDYWICDCFRWIVLIKCF